MTMLKSFDLQGRKESFASFISDLSPCETPFTSMIGKESIDQIQYSWQTDRLTKPKDPNAADGKGADEGGAATFVKRAATQVHHNYTAILRKVVRVTDSTKKIELYGRPSELQYQLEKAGMEIKRDLEFMTLNSREQGVPGTATTAGKFSGVQHLVASATPDADTGAVVRKVIQYAAGANVPKFTQIHVFDMTYNLYLAGSKANKIMFHPMHMHVFSDWIGDNATVTPHVHRMFDGLDTKFNSHVSTLRDPLGQVYELIPNRYMPKNQLFFFNESDWTQMILRAPEKVELAKNGSSEKHMIEMEVGLRHRNPYASGILEFNLASKSHVVSAKAAPSIIKADNTVESTVTINLANAAGAATGVTDTPVVTHETFNDDGSATSATVSAAAAASDGVATVKVKHAKGARVKVKAVVEGTEAVTTVDTYTERG